MQLILKKVPHTIAAMTALGYDRFFGDSNISVACESHDEPPQTNL